MKKYKVVIVGGGSTWTPGLLKSLCEKKNEFPMEELRMYDINAERQAVIGEFAKILFAEEYPDLKFLYTTDKAQAYKDVDFVFCQIRSGGFDMRMLDEQIPLAHGVVGQETCGAGGFAYGLRSIPDMIQIVRDARTYANDPWILNYTNPAAIVAVALERVFPGDKRIVNMCDQPVNLLQSFAKVLGIRRQDIIPEYVGLNHFGWFTKLTDRDGNDLLAVQLGVYDQIPAAGKDSERRLPAGGCSRAGCLLAAYLRHGADHYAGFPGLCAEYLFAVLSVSGAGSCTVGSGSYPHGGGPQRQREARVYPVQAGCTAGLNEGPDHR